MAGPGGGLAGRLPAGRDRYESLEKQDYSNYLALMKYYASRAKQEQDAALAQQKLEASAARSGSARSSSGGSRKASLSSTASESLERTMNTYLSQGDTGRVKQLFLQYRDRMTPLQKRRFEKLMGKYNIPMTEWKKTAPETPGFRCCLLCCISLLPEQGVYGGPVFGEVLCLAHTLEIRLRPGEPGGQVGPQLPHPVHYRLIAGQPLAVGLQQAVVIGPQLLR